MPFAPYSWPCHLELRCSSHFGSGNVPQCDLSSREPVPLFSPGHGGSHHLSAFRNLIRRCVTLLLLLGCLPLWASDPDLLLQQAEQLAAAGKHAEAVAKYDSLLQEKPEFSFGYYLRGREQFLAGRFAPSLADFNEHVRLSPTLEARQWERGLAMYYVGEYAAGAKQFELYQTFHNQDVENSVWRYLCSAKVEGVAAAKANMLPIERDERVPLMEVFALYRGERQVRDVFAAVEAGQPNERERRVRLFYANLYVGLWYDSLGDYAQAAKYIEPAARDPQAVTYMGRVAEHHWQLLQTTLAELKGSPKDQQTPPRNQESSAEKVTPPLPGK